MYTFKVVQTVCIDYGIYDLIELGSFDTLEKAQAFSEDKYNTSIIIEKEWSKMKIEELLKFNGKDIMEYQKAIEQRDRARRSIWRLKDKKYDLEIAIEILEGDERQAIKKQELEKIEDKINKKLIRLEKIEKYIKDNQY